jgi:protein-S-isoprenylcysteine O-methyltransferase Ste14
MGGMTFNGALFAKGFLAVLIVQAMLLSMAGRMRYWQVWLFGSVNILFVAIVSTLFTGSGSIFQERLRPGPGTKRWDRMLWVLYGPANVAILVLAALDAGRFQWASGYPPAVYLLGYLIYICGGLLHLWSIRVNPSYVSTVSIREEKGHSVVDQGPYRLMRHPGYTGIILMVNSIAIVLGSRWALIPSSVVSGLLVLRTILEDRTLQRELSGYKEYARRVRSRLVPGIW